MFIYFLLISVNLCIFAYTSSLMRLYESLCVICVLEYTISDTFSFPVIFREDPLDSNEKYVSYDVK